MDGKNIGETDFVEGLVQLWCILLSTEIQYFAEFSKSRFIAAISTLIGLVIAAILTGLFAGMGGKQ